MRERRGVPEEEMKQIRRVRVERRDNFRWAKNKQQLILASKHSPRIDAHFASTWFWKEEKFKEREKENRQEKGLLFVNCSLTFDSQSPRISRWADLAQSLHLLNLSTSSVHYWSFHFEHHQSNSTCTALVPTNTAHNSFQFSDLPQERISQFQSKRNDK